ncbi:hypothetical protein B0H14DRAFT_3456092 [Mycena olivaceomarginata]|nr:hypothetical protein B0H14DRAFT_3456092 [Mycena olivaceomarginata]
MDVSEVANPRFADHAVNSAEWLDSLLHLNDGQDVFLVIAPGFGKSVVLFAPLIAAQARGERGIAFMIVPTKVLAEQQAEVGRKYGLRAVAINEDSVREAYTRENRDLCAECLLVGTASLLGL